MTTSIAESASKDEPASQEELNKTKTLLEIAKLKRDIEQSNSNWWARPVYLSIITPLIVGAITVAFNYFNGVYDVEYRLKRAELSLVNRKVEEVELIKARESLIAAYCASVEDWSRIQVIVSGSQLIDKIQNVSDGFRRTIDFYEFEVNSMDRVQLSLDSLENELEEVIKISEGNIAKLNAISNESPQEISEILSSYDDLCTVSQNE